MHVETDEKHPAAQSVMMDIRNGIYGKMVTTNYIIDELITLLRNNVTHHDVVKIGNAVRSTPNIYLVWIDEVIEQKSWEYFQKYQDKTYSFTDCTSFVIMNAMKIELAFAYDAHFDQSGFHVIQ